jgi:hypothetical protein
MQTRRLAVTAALALCATSALPATAATRPKPKPKPAPVCKLVVDVADDAGVANHAAGAPSNDPSLDIVSADIATDATNLTAVIRVKKLSAANTMAPLGQRWTLRFTFGVTTMGLSVNTGPAGSSGPQVASGYKIDPAANEVRITVPLKNLPEKVGKGTPFRNLYAETAAAISYDREKMGTPDSTTLSPEDHAESTKTYAAGTPSCVKIGQ